MEGRLYGLDNKVGVITWMFNSFRAISLENCSKSILSDFLLYKRLFYGGFWTIQRGRERKSTKNGEVQGVKQIKNIKEEN